MLNLHSIARGAIVALHPEEPVTLYQSSGQTNTRGVVSPTYEAVQTVQAQIQSLSTDELANVENVAQTGQVRKAYLFGPPVTSLIPQGIVRPLARSGDMIQRADGTWWLVTGMMEDFSASGWVCVQITQQVNAPQGVDSGD